MALVIKDRVKETTTTTGTGNIALGGAVSNFVTFSSILSDGDTTYYAIVDSNNSDFEVGLGTYASSGNTIARTTVLASSNSGSVVDLSAGSKVIFCAFPADKAVIEDANGVVSIENLQFDTNAIKSTNTNGNIQLFPAGTGFTELYGNTNAGAIRFNCESNSHGVTLKGPPHSASATYSLELPNADGSAGQLLKTDGSGKLAFTSSLPGITATASEINILDGVTATTSEINILDGVTATTSEINILDGVTATTAELNYVDGVTSNIQTQIDSISPSPTFTATASGAIANGDPVILNSAGTVSAVAGRAAANGDNTDFPGADTLYLQGGIAAVFDSSNNKVVVFYSDAGNSNYGTAAVATISGTSISFGSAATFVSAQAEEISATFDSSNNKVVVSYVNASDNKAYAAVGTVSGTSISFGTPVEWEAGAARYTATTFDSNSNKVVVACQDSGNSSYGTARVGTVSGTSISFGTAVVFESATTEFTGATFDSTNNKVVIVYSDGGNNTRPTAIVGTVSGTDISFGTAVEISTENNTNSLQRGVAFDSTNGKVLVTYAAGGTSGSNVQFKSAVGTVSGTSISFGDQVTIDSDGISGASNGGQNSMAFDSDAGKMLIAYPDAGGSNVLTIVAGTISGTTVTYETVTTHTNNGTGAVSASAFDSSSGAFFTGLRAGGASDKGRAIITKLGFTNLTGSNFVGISDAAYSNGATATIQIIGSVDDAQSSLSIGQNYFVTSTGTIATAGRVFAGKALSSTELAVKLPTFDSYTFLQKYEPAGATDIIDIEAFDTDAFSAYMILLDNLIHASGNGDFRVYYKVDGSYRTDNKYSRRLIRTDQQGTGISTSDNSSSSQNRIDLGNEAEFTGLMHVFFTVSNNAVHDNTLLTYDFNSQRNSGGENSFTQGSATYYNSSLNSNRLQGLRIDGGSNLTGTVALYGISKG